jgi:hypothetical protein
MGSFGNFIVSLAIVTLLIDHVGGVIILTLNLELGTLNRAEGEWVRLVKIAQGCFL